MHTRVVKVEDVDSLDLGYGRQFLVVARPPLERSHRVVRGSSIGAGDMGPGGCG
jgi:hypothetical protein